MQPPSWTQIAIQYSATIAAKAPPQRGLMPVEGHADVLCLFGPYHDLQKIKQRVGDARFEILATGSSVVSPGESVFAMLVRSVDKERLSAVLNAVVDDAAD